jgi:hypothetical protein
MRSAREEFRSLIDTFEPKSREYWQTVGSTLLGLIQKEDAESARSGFKKSWGILKAFGSCLLREIVPLLPSLWFEHRIKSAVRTARDDYDIPEHALPCLELSKDELKDAHKLELGRREQFTRKAQAYLMGVTVGVSFAVGMLGLSVKVHPAEAIPLILKIALGVVVLSLFMAAISALHVIAPSESWDLWLQERYAGAKEDLQKKQLLKLTLLNQAYNLIAASCLSASYIGMRNGVYLVLSLLMWAIVIG